MEYVLERKKNGFTKKKKKNCYYFCRIRRGVFFFLFDEEEEFSQFSLSAMVDYIFRIVNYLISLFSLQIWKDLKHCQLLIDLWQILCVIMSHLQQKQWNFNCSEILLNNKKKSSMKECLDYVPMSHGHWAVPWPLLHQQPRVYTGQETWEKPLTLVQLYQIQTDLTGKDFIGTI